jgi:CRP-like cAMP-binding protein
MFQRLPDERLDLLARHMEYKVVDKNTVLLRQGQKSDRFFLLESGDIRRKKVDPSTGKAHTIEYAIKATSINSMKVIAGDPVVRDAKNTSCDGHLRTFLTAEFSRAVLVCHYEMHFR